MSFTNYFDVLGMDPDDLKGLNESQIKQEIKKARNELAKLDQPDIMRANGASEADIAAGETHMKSVNEAYSVLIDPSQRAAHIAEIEALSRPTSAPKPKAAQPKTNPKAQPKPQAKAKPADAAHNAKAQAQSHHQTKTQTKARPRPKSARRAWNKTIAGFLITTAFKTAAKGIDSVASFIENKEDQLRKASWKRADAMALRIALGIPKMILTNGVPAVLAASLLLGAVKTASTPLGSIPEEFRDQNNPICSTDFARNLSADDFNTVAWLYASTENPRFRQMLLSNTRAHIATGFNLEYALVQAYIESSWGENTTATTSTARGNHQFLEQSWLERFRKDAAAFSPEYAPLAAQIYWANDANGDPLPSNGWRVRDGQEDEILNLRMTDPDLEAFLSLNWRKELHPDLVTTLGDVDRTPIQALLEETNFDVVANFLSTIPPALAAFIHRAEPPITESELQRVETILTHQQFAEAYRTQLLGPTGGASFNARLNGGERYQTASSVFALQARANPGLFGRTGQFSFVEVDARIGDKITEAQNAIQDAEIRGIVQGGVTRVCDTRFGM